MAELSGQKRNDGRIIIVQRSEELRYHPFKIIDPHMKKSAIEMVVPYGKSNIGRFVFSNGLADVAISKGYEKAFNDEYYP